MSNTAQHLQATADILQPLQKALAINYFTYWRYQQGKAEVVSSDPIAAERFINDADSNLPLEASRILNWQDYCSENYFDYITERYKSVGIGLTFVLRHTDTDAEHISINAEFQAVNKIKEIKSNPQLVNQLITHIRNQVNFRKDDFTPISFKKDISTTQSPNKLTQDDFFKLHHREFIIGLNGPTYITKAEKKCLLLLLQLKTSKEMASDQNTTMRTIECHISSLRKKLGVTKRHHFYQVACNNFISPIEAN